MLVLLLIAAMPVALDGPIDAVHDVTSALVERGIQVEPAGLPPGDTGVLSIQLEQLDGAFKVSIRDPWGRSAERSVKDLLTAVAWIESWSRMELIEGSISATTTTTTHAKQPLEHARPVHPAATEAITKAPAKELRSTALWRLSGEAGVGRDDSRWIGLSLSACERVGFACFGITARYARSDFGGQGADLLVDLDAPLSAGPLTLTLGVGAGGGWSRFPGSPEYDDPRNRFTFVRSRLPEEAILPRVEAHAMLALRMFDDVNLAIGAAATSTPFFDDHHGELSDRGTILRAQAGLMWGLP